jgi:hypothetical protein
MMVDKKATVSFLAFTETLIELGYYVYSKSPEVSVKNFAEDIFPAARFMNFEQFFLNDGACISYMLASVELGMILQSKKMGLPSVNKILYFAQKTYARVAQEIPPDAQQVIAQAEALITPFEKMEQRPLFQKGKRVF